MDFIHALYLHWAKTSLNTDKTGFAIGVARESPSSAGYSACYLPGTLDKDATPRTRMYSTIFFETFDYETCSHESDMYCTTRQSIATCIYDKPNKTLSKMTM